MTDRKCVQCGAVLNQHNLGRLCFPCQEKNLRELRQKAGDSPNYYISDMCSILGLGPEQVRRLGRKNVIPGRIPEIKKHAYLKVVVDEWISSGGESPASSSESFSDIELEATDEAQGKAMDFDKKLFIKTDRIMKERDIRNLLLGLELHHSYALSEYLKMANFWEFVGLEGNKYNDPELRQLLEDLLAVLDEFAIFLKLEFEEDAGGKGGKDMECRLNPTGLKYINDESSKVQRVTEAENKLDELIKTTRDKYRAYRAGIRSKLYQ